MKKVLQIVLLFALISCLLMSICIKAVGVEIETPVLGASSSISLNNYPNYPQNGQQYWIIFREGYRNNRVEMSTCDSIGDSANLWIKWDKNLTLQGASTSGKVNQYYLNSSNDWEQIGTYGIFSDYATEVIASNLDVYDSNNNIVLSKSSSYSGANSSCVFLESIPIIEYDQYSGNMGDSFVYPLGKHPNTRGNVDIYGDTHQHGIEGWVARWNYTDEQSWAYSVFDLAGKYKSLRGTYKLIKSYNTSNFNTTLAFYGDGNLLKSYLLTPNTGAFDIIIDVSGINHLKVHFYDNDRFSGGTSFGLINMLLDSQGTRANSVLSNNRFTVYQNSNGKYKASKDAKIEYDGQDYMTDAFGTVSMPTIDSGSVVVSKSGFITRTLTAEQLKVSKNIYLEPTNDNAPVVTAVWVENTDVLHDSYPLPMTSKEKTTIRAEVDWGKYSYGSIKLWQDGKTADFSNDTLSMVFSSQFDTSNAIKLIATDSENRQTEKTLLIENSTVNQALKNLDGISFDFNDSINLTLPDSVPLIGGMKVGAGLSSAVPISISADKGKVYVSIGAQLFHGETKGENGKATESKKIIGFINNFKENFKDNKDAVSKLKKFKNTFKNDLAKPKGKFGVEADFTLIGFAEGTFDESGKVTWLDTGLILNPSVSISKDFPFAIGPIPLYFEVGLSAEVLAQLNLRLNEQAKNFIPNGEISGKLALNGGVGIGVKKVLYAGGGLEGSLNPDWKINIGKQDYFTLKAKLSAYAKAGILIFEGKKTWDLAEKTLIEYPSKNSINSVGALLDDYNLYDYSNYKIKDLSYLDSTLPGSKVGEAVGANAGVSVGSTQLKNNIYRESTPQLVVFDNGTKLAVWTDSESSDINGICLYYSFFDGSNWSSPTKVYNDGTMDYAPQMVESNGKAFLVWQNATKAFDITDNLSLETIAKDFDISVAVFDGQAFTTTILQNENLDMQPVICADGENAYIAWVNNVSNDWFGSNTDNSILVSRYENSTWLQPEVVYSGLNSIDNLAIDYNNGINLAYCVDTDGDINTTDDLRVYENGVLVSGEKNSACSPQYSQHKLYWYSDNSILFSDIEAPENNVITSDRYQLVNSNRNLAAVFTEANGLYSKVSVSYFNTETGAWGTPKTLADNESAIGAFSADTDKDGNIEVLINNCAVVGDYDDEEPYGTSTLMLFEDSDYCDISISEPLYDEENFCVNEPMIFDIDLTNNGSNIIKGVDVSITDSTGTLLNSVYIENMIVPGETLEAPVFYIPDNRYVSQSVTITATPKNSTDGDLSNNSQTVILSYENLSVENLTSAEMANGNIAISADIVNWGYQDSDSVTIKLIKDSLDGQVVETKTINGINSLDMQTVSFEVSDTNRRNYFVCIEGEVDSFSADNSDCILIHHENMIGDTNLDGSIDIRDVTAIQRQIAKLEVFTDEQIALADTNGDGVVNITDATHLQMYLAKYDVVLGKA